MLGTTIREAHAAFSKGLLTPSHMTRMALKRVKRLQPTLNAATETLDERAVKSLENDLSEAPLRGIPVAVKDNFCLAGTTCGSKMLRPFKPTYNATVVRRTDESGAVVVAKSNLDEFGMGSGCVDSCFGPSKSVWRSGMGYQLRNSVGEARSALNNTSFSAKTCLDRTDGFVAGGSSGGSASLVAAGAVCVALGSDTGGSVRIPAAWSGIVGLKPSYGRLSRHGLIPLVNSLDVPGIMGRCVDDVAIYFDALKGFDAKDSTSLSDDDVNYIKQSQQTSGVTKEPREMAVGIPQEYFCEDMSDEVVQAWSDVADVLENEGVRVKRVSLPHTKHSITCYQVLNPCEVASNMARYDGIQYGLRTDNSVSTEALFADVRHHGFNEVVRGRILAGNYFLLREHYDEYFLQALRVRRLITQDFERAFEEVDMLLTPTTLTEAPSFKDFTSADNRTQTAKHDYCTQPVNMAGVPALSLPVKLSSNSLPLSVQLIGPYLGDEAVLAMAQFIEKKVDFPRLHLDHGDDYDGSLKTEDNGSA